MALVGFTGSLGPACATGPNLSTDYAQTAIENFELAEAEFTDKDWEQATSYADFVRIRFPFSRYSVEAELLAARAQFELGNHLRAQDAFRQFSKLHPTHKHVVNGWVDYMVAVCAYMAVPESNWPLPAHYELDQAALQSALEELDYFFDRHADKTMAAHAKNLRDRIHRKLLEHELYVAEYYLDGKRPEAAIGRLTAAHGRFPGIGMDAELLFVLGRTYLEMNEIELARATFHELNQEHAEHAKGHQAGVYLEYIKRTFGPADPDRARPDRSRQKPKRPPRLKKDAFKRRGDPPANDAQKEEQAEANAKAAQGNENTQSSPKAANEGRQGQGVENPESATKSEESPARESAVAPEGSASTTNADQTNERPNEPKGDAKTSPEP